MAEVIELKISSLSLSEYALSAWTELTDAGLNPLDGLLQIQSEIEGYGSDYKSDEIERALRLISQWRDMAKSLRARFH